MTTIAPVRREVLVRTDLATAFALFTAHIGAWWPLETFSVHGADASVAFEAGELVERHGASVEVWAEVLDWEPPDRLRLSWHPGTDPVEATEVTVSFTTRGDQVLVALDHVGWERRPDPAEAAASYGEGWPLVLGRFAARTPSSSSSR